MEDWNGYEPQEFTDEMFDYENEIEERQIAAAEHGMLCHMGTAYEDEDGNVVAVRYDVSA